MRDREFFLKLASQKKHKEFSQSWIVRTLKYSDGVCMALACAFIWRNARKKKGSGPKQLDGMTEQDLKKLQAYFDLIDKEPFRKAVANTRGAAPEGLRNVNAPNFEEEYKKFSKEAVPQAEQDRHLLIAGVTNAISNRIKQHERQLGAHEDGVSEDDKQSAMGAAKIAGIRNQIMNMSDLKFSPPPGLVRNGTGDEFYYVSEGGHGWALAVRRGDQKFKLFDPNNGIIWFATAEDLYKGAEEYAEGGAVFLRFI